MDRIEWYYGKRNIYASEWPVENPKGVVQIVHGMIEHIGRYETFIKELNQEGYVVVGEDHMGHGRTARDRKNFGVFTGGWMDLVEDVADLQRQTAAKYPGLTYIMLGHSMGSFENLCIPIWGSNRWAYYYGNWPSATFFILLWHWCIQSY